MTDKLWEHIPEKENYLVINTSKDLIYRCSRKPIQENSHSKVYQYTDIYFRTSFNICKKFLMLLYVNEIISVSQDIDWNKLNATMDAYPQMKEVVDMAEEWIQHHKKT